VTYLLVKLRCTD